MNLFAETERLLLREFDFCDEHDFFEMDSDPEVHRYIENKPLDSIEQVRDIIRFVQSQYVENGIGRWAVVDKKTNECLGWCGLKYFQVPLNDHVDIYELGYRFKRKHWGKGYATESSIAVLDYGFENLKIDIIYALADVDHSKSLHVLRKLGFEHIEVFDYDGKPCDWFELPKAKWIGRRY